MSFNLPKFQLLQWPDNQDLFIFFTKRLFFNPFLTKNIYKIS